MLRHQRRKDIASVCGQSGAATNERFLLPASFYMDAYGSYRSAASASLAAGSDTEPDAFRLQARLPDRKARVKLAIASKGTESIPFVIQMLGSTDPEERRDAVEVLALMGGDDRVVNSLIESIAAATDPDSATTLVRALGATRSPRSIPYLARILRAPGIHSATMAAAVASLAQLSGRGFHDAENPRASALAWLAENGYGSIPPEFPGTSGYRPPDSTVPGGLVNVQLHSPRRSEHRKVTRASTEDSKE